MIAAKVVGGGQIRTKLLQHPTWASSLEPSSGPRPHDRTATLFVRNIYTFTVPGYIDARFDIC